MRFGLFFFSSSINRPDVVLRAVLEACRVADNAGLAFVSVPERHFGEFGGVFPNPAVMAAAIAVVTRRIEIRAGSLVGPINHAVRVVEDWSVIDNLSGGRVAISFGSGWNINDFILAPGLYNRRREVL